MKINDILPLTEAIQTFYHGSPVKIDKFTFDFLSSGQGADQEGPGIYLTSSAQDARIYGKFIHEVKVNVVKTRLMPERRVIRMEYIRGMIWNSPDFQTEDYMNWDENPKRALMKATDAVMDAYGPTQYREAMEQVWYDYYRYHSQLYLQTVGRTWDGFALPRAGGITHLIWFKPELLKIVGVQQVE